MIMLAIEIVFLLVHKMVGRDLRNNTVTYCMKAYLMLVFLVAIASGSRNHLESKSISEANHFRNKGELHEKPFSSPNIRWDREDILAENEIIRHETSTRKKHKSQLDYVCGRAVVDKKYRDFFLNDQGYQVSRSKYRPTEIRMPRIIGGDDTTPGEFPWTVSVKLNGQPICGGSLIDRSWILTAAHCVVGYNPKNLTIRSGAYRIKDQSETQTVDSSVSMFIIHKEYSIPRPFSNDIALLKLTEPLEYSDFIVPVCLPKPDSRPEEVSSNSISDNFKNYKSNAQKSSDETGGIVVSTKMSDTDIAHCFSRIEQNYLESIGMGSTAQTEAPASVTTAALTSNQLVGEHPSHLVSDNMESINKAQMSQLAQYQRHFSPQELQKLQQMILQLNANNLDFYGHPVQSKSVDTEGGEKYRKDTIKLSRLPISKELLHEIQSVGSGPMQTLGLNQGYFVTNEFNNQITSQTSAPEREKVSMFLASHKNQAVQAPSKEAVDDSSRYSIGLSGTVVGWGWVRETEVDEHTNKGHTSTTLQKVKLPILHNSVCEAWFQSQSKKITLLPSQFCAGFSSGGKDACRGDSGGPMIIEDDSNAERYTLIGIVSAGIGCARPSLPGLYTRVASFLPWIKAQINRY